MSRSDTLPWSYPLPGGGVLSSDQVSEHCGRVGIDVAGLMVELLDVATEYARAPISDFRVGAVVEAEPEGDRIAGALYLGANLEFVGQSLGSSVHAEQAAVINAWQHGARRVRALATSAAPCGHCRQFLHELAGADALLILEPSTLGADEARGYTSTTLDLLLPHAFGAQDLGVDGGLLDPRFEEPTLAIAQEDPDALTTLALEAARRSYAPYSGGHAGCAVETASGERFAGRYAENAAYNPSVSPLEAALSNMVMNGTAGPPGDSHGVRRAVLVEQTSAVGQRPVTEALLATVAPGVVLEYHVAQSR